jgi:hypothetical protein
VIAAPTPARLLELVEEGRDRHPLDRALLALGAADPSAGWDELAALPVGRRDARLLELRERLFGRRLRFACNCPGCGEKMEADADARELRGRDDATVASEHELREGGATIRFRLPDSRDLAAVLRLPDEAAGEALLSRCVLAKEQVEELSPELLARLDREMAAADAQAEITLNLTCPLCGRSWSELFDPGGYLWTELEVEALRLIGEVHALALAYGWREDDILRLSPKRRRSYLEQVGA